MQHYVQGPVCRLDDTFDKYVVFVRKYTVESCSPYMGTYRTNLALSLASRNGVISVHKREQHI